MHITHQKYFPKAKSFHHYIMETLEFYYYILLSLDNSTHKNSQYIYVTLYNIILHYIIYYSRE